MSFQAMTWAAAQRLRPGPKILLMALANRADHEHGKCWPSIGSICDETGLLERSVQRYLRELEAAGLVVIEERHADGGRQTSNLYRLAIPGAAAGRQAAQPYPREGDNLAPSGVSHLSPPRVSPVTPLEPVRGNNQRNQVERERARADEEPCPDSGHGPLNPNGASETPPIGGVFGPVEENGPIGPIAHAGNVDGSDLGEPCRKLRHGPSGGVRSTLVLPESAEDPAFALALRMWPTAACDGVRPAREAWTHLALDEREAAVAGIAPFLTNFDASGRKLLCSLGTYLVERRWKLLATEAPETTFGKIAEGGSAGGGLSAVPCTPEWWVLLFSRLRRGESAKLMMSWAASGKAWVVRRGEWPSSAELDGFVQAPPGDERRRTWGHWLAARGVGLDRLGSDAPVWLPAHETPSIEGVSAVSTESPAIAGFQTTHEGVGGGRQLSPNRPDRRP